jgi:hypothetical protein
VRPRKVSARCSLLVETDADALLARMAHFHAPSLAKWEAHPPSADER